MTFKEKLVQFCDIQQEIKELEIKINKLEKQAETFDIVEGSSLTMPYQKKNIKIKHVDLKKKINLNYYQSILEKRMQELLEMQIEVEEFISSIPTSRLRRIFEYRYIEQFSWTKIAFLIGGSATADSIRMEHIRFLEKNNICSNCSEKI